MAKESQGEARSVPYIPGQEYQKFDYKIKRIRRKKRSGVRGRRKRSRVIRYCHYYGTAEGEGDDDVGLFTRLWRWIGSFFTCKTAAATTSLHQEKRRDVCLEDAAMETTSLPKDVDVHKKQTDLQEEKIVGFEKNDDNKKTTTCDISEEERKVKDVIKDCPDDSSIEKQKGMVLENDKALNVKDSWSNENVVSGCFTVQQLETHVLQQTEDPKRIDLVPLKKLESKPSLQLPVDTAIETASSGPGCRGVRTLETHVLQQTEDPKRFDLVPLKQLEGKPSSQLPVDTTAETPSSAPESSFVVQKLESHVEPSQKLTGKTADNKVKVIKREKGSGVKGRRKRKGVIRDHEDRGTAENVHEDVGLFTRLWQWIGSFVSSRKTTPATTSLQREVHLDDGPESQGEARSVPYIPGQDYQKFDYKIKRIRRKKRSGARGRRKRSRVIRYRHYYGTAEGEGDDDVGLFTRLWRWIGSFFTCKTAAATTSLHQEERRDVCLEDAATKTTSLPKDVDVHKKQTDLQEEKIVGFEKNDDNKTKTTTCDIREDERKAKDVIKDCPDDSSIEKQKEMTLEKEKALDMEDSCTNEGVVYGCYSVRQLEAHVQQETEDLKVFDLAPLKQLESKLAQLPVAEGSLEARNKTVMESDGDKSILDKGSRYGLQETDDSKTVCEVPLPKKHPEHNVATAPRECKHSTTSRRKNAPSTTTSRDAELSSGSKVQPSKGRSTSFKGNGENDCRKQAGFVRPRQLPDRQAKDNMPSTKRYYKPRKNAPKPHSRNDQENHLSWRNGSKESAESSKVRAHSTWANQKKGSESHLVPSSNWRRSSSKGDMSSNWRKDNGTDKSVSKSQTLSWRKGTNNTRASSNEGTLPYRRNNKETRAGPCESNWRMRSESKPRKQRNDIKEKSKEELHTSTRKAAKEKVQQDVKESAPKMTYAQALLGGCSAVRNQPAIISHSPARGVQSEARSFHGQRRHRSNPISR